MRYTLLILALMLGQSAFAQVPKTISYQGVLTDDIGNAIADDSYKLKFELHSTPNNGNIPWKETHENVPVVKGIFNVILGSVNPLDISFDEPLFLAIAVNDGERLEPFTPLTSAPYSLGLADSVIVGNKIADGQVVRVLEISPINGFTASLKDTVRLKAGANITFDADGGPDGGIFISATSSNNGGDGHSLDAADGDPIDAVFVDSNGNVGIGTTSPSEQLEITGSLELPASTANTGIIKVGGERFIHNFGGSNLFAGRNSGNFITTGNQNTAIGSFTLIDNTSGRSNTAAGSGALSNNTTGDNNTAIGQSALAVNTGGSFNTATGIDALFSNRGNGNTGMGDRALSLTTTGDQNAAVGDSSLRSNTSGSFNTAIGSNADVSAGNLTNATAIGANAVVDASNKIRLGDDNITVVEANAMFHSLSGGFKFPDATVQTTASAGNSSPWQTVGADIFFEKGRIAIGTDASSNIVTVVKGSTTDPIADAWTTYSSRRWKTNIETIKNPLETVQALRGVTYDWKTSGKHDIGLIAEEVGEFIPEIVAYEENGVDAKSVDYARLVAVLIEGMKAQQLEIVRLRQGKSELQKLKTRFNELEKRLHQSSLVQN